MSKQIGKLLLVGILCGAGIGLSFFSEKEAISLTIIIKYLAFGEFHIGRGYVFYFLKQYFPYLLFQSIWGTYLYRHFCSGSIYYFSRMQNRSRWYWMEASKQFLIVIIFLFVYLATSAIVIGLSYDVMIEDTDIWFGIYYFGTQIAWLYTLVMMTNIFSICWGSSRGYMVTAGIIFAFVCYFVLLEDILDFTTGENMVLKVTLLKINPLSHIVLKWHSCGVESVDVYMRTLGIDFSIWSSVLFLSVIAIIGTLWGDKVIKNQEFIVMNRETGGAL